MRHIVVPSDVPIYKVDGKTPEPYGQVNGTTTNLVMNLDRFVDTFVVADPRMLASLVAIRQSGEILDACKAALPGETIKISEGAWQQLKAVVEAPAQGYRFVHVARQSLAFANAIVDAKDPDAP